MAKKKQTRRKREPAAKKKGKRQPVLARIIKWLAILSIWIVIIAGGLSLWHAYDLPDITESATFERKNAITVKAYDGTILARYGEIQGLKVSVDELPTHLIQAVLAIEDRRFYDHGGIDFIGTFRAAVENIRAGRLVQGGSTITQQLAKNLFLSHERTLERKIQEAYLALWLEQELTKDEILSAYLNRVYMGSGTYGVDAAAKLYFNKPATALNLREAAIIAGLLKAPSRFSPLRNPRLAERRARVVLGAMVEAGYISRKQADTLSTPPPTPRRKPSGANATRYFTDWIIDGIEDVIGTPDEDLIIYTTLSPAIQSAAEQSLSQSLRANGVERQIGQGAVVVLRPDGAVQAMVGGRDYKISQFNRITQSRRQPGSAFKPIIFLSALENGWSPRDTILDGPIEDSEYSPKNFKDEYYGEVSLSFALAMSLNTSAVRLLKDIGPDAAISTARKLGVISPLTNDLSLALGSSGMSLLELSMTYAAIANGGYKIIPYGITKITSADGDVYYERAEYQRTRQVISGRHVREMRRMLSDVIENGTGQQARLPRPAFGKTGTSQNNRDAWFIGFTDEYIAGVWLGNDDNTPMKHVTGGMYPAQIWRHTMEKIEDYESPTAAFRIAPDQNINTLLNRLLGGSQYND